MKKNFLVVKQNIKRYHRDGKVIYLMYNMCVYKRSKK